MYVGGGRNSQSYVIYYMYISISCYFILLSTVGALAVALPVRQRSDRISRNPAPTEILYVHAYIPTVI